MLSPRVDLYPTGMREFLLAENKMAENEKAAWVAFDCHAPLHGGFIAGNGGGDRDGAFAQPVDPATVVEPHLEG